MKLEPFLQQKGVNYERHSHVPAYTAQDLAGAEHVSGYMVAKPVIVKGDGGFTMCVLPAPKHVDLKRVADVLGEREVHLATESEMAGIFDDCELGAEPPIGALHGLKTIMDRQLEEEPQIVLQAGTHTEALKVRCEDYRRVCQPVVADISTS